MVERAYKMPITGTKTVQPESEEVEEVCEEFIRHIRKQLHEECSIRNISKPALAQELGLTFGAFNNFMYGSKSIPVRALIIIMLKRPEIAVCAINNVKQY